MPIVDGHVHAGLTKYVAIEVLLAQMDHAGIDQALLVQYGGCFDNEYLLGCRQRFPGRFAALGAVDYQARDAGEQIRRQVPACQLAGLRIPAATQSEAVWEAVAEVGCMASLSGGMEYFVEPRIEDYIRRFPHVPFRLEHMGWFPDLDRDPDDYPEFERLLSYAAYPNVYFMVSGFYSSGKKFPYREAVPFVRRAFERFGPRRMMWGSDFPPVSYHETVEMALALPQSWDFWDGEDLDWVMGGTARSLFQF